MDSRGEKLIDAFYKAILGFSNSLSIILGIILLLGLFKVYVTHDMITSIFTGDLFKDTLLGAILGSILTGNPITSYIIGGELLRDNVSLFAVTSFILSWVTVGLVQLPAEILFLGKRFAITRNLLSFLLSIVISILTVLTLEVVV
ncbi:MAG: permease [Thermoplasmata archaeon]|nr:MAG: permease [Thermoplasmata archaeon]HEC89468.1 permease [Thermoplasmatales archaeon]